MAQSSGTAPQAELTLGRAILSVAVITKDRPAMLSACLREALAQGFPADRMELVVLDDGSSPPAAAENRRCVEELRGRGLRRVAFETNASARNTAAARAQALAAVAKDADWILSLDDDALMEPGALASLLEAGKDRSIGVVGPKVVFKDRPELVCSGPNFVGRWSGRYTTVDPRGPVDCDWILTTCLLIRGSVLRAVQGFYGGYVTGHEDVDFCLQVRRAGFRVAFEPAAVVRHDTVPGLMRPGRLYYLFRNKALMIRRNFTGLRRWSALAFYAGPSLAANWIRVVGAGGRLGTVGELLRAYLDGLRGREGRGPDG